MDWWSEAISMCKIRQSSITKEVHIDNVFQVYWFEPSGRAVADLAG
jgi:hypothetical protein